MDNMMLRLQPYEYAHILNKNTNTIELIVGPETCVLPADKKLSKPVTPFHVVPSGSYCVIESPHVVESDGVTPARDEYGQVKVRMGEREIRYGAKAFPLFPEEKLVLLSPMPVLRQDEALVLRALCNYTCNDGVKRTEGERFLRMGPGVYFPRVEEEAEEVRRAVIIKRDCGIRLSAVEAFTDRNGYSRREGEEYIRTEPASYICSVSEVFVEHISPTVLHPGEGLHVEVLQWFVDEREHAKGVERLPGQAYLLTHEECPSFLLHPYEKILCTVKKLHVGKKQYAVVLTENNSPSRRVITDTSFYLRPGEVLEGGVIHNSYILHEGQALLLKALDDFEDMDVQPSVKRQSGEVFLLKGPREYIPNCFTEICKDKNNGDIRERIVLSDGMGIYVRNIITGEVRTVNGPAVYMLGVSEELWEKKLSPDVERCLQQQKISSCEASIIVSADKVASPTANGDGGGVAAAQQLQGKTHFTVMYKVPNRCVTQVYNYKTLKTRIIFGPDRVHLEPEEDFLVVSLSGSPQDPTNPGKCLPKESNRIKSLHLFLGPSSMTDIVHVETRDHAQLALKFCYAWYFDVLPGDEAAARKCFSVTDFVGDTCLYVAARIRAAVTSLPFQQFHKNSSKIMQEAVFGVDPVTGAMKTELRFNMNNLVITSVDTQQMEVLDPRTREDLQKSVKMAIEISTQAQESIAQQIALAREQQSRSLLEQQKMEDQVENERQRRILLQAEADSLAMQSSGRFKSIANAAAKAANVEQEAGVQVARIRSEKENITNELLAEIETKKQALKDEYETKRLMLAHELEKQLADIENEKFASIMGAIDPETVKEISKAAPELQAKLLGSMGLEGYLVMDGSTPINLFRTAAEMTR